MDVSKSCSDPGYLHPHTEMIHSLCLIGEVRSGRGASIGLAAAAFGELVLLGRHDLDGAAKRVVRVTAASATGEGFSRVGSLSGGGTY